MNGFKADADQMRSSPEHGRNFDNWSSLLNVIEMTDNPEKTTIDECKKQRRLAAEKLVDRTGLVEGALWLGERLNSPPLDCPPSYVVQLSADDLNKLHVQDRAASDTLRPGAENIALVPYAPPTEYFRKLPKNRFKPENQLDEKAMRILQTHGLDELHQLGASDKEYAEALKTCGGWEQLTEVYATWCTDSKIDGADWSRSYTHSSKIQSIVESGEIESNRGAITDNVAKSVMLPMPMNLDLAARKANSELCDLQLRMRTCIATNSHDFFESKEYRGTVGHLFTTYHNVIDVCRWHLEHGNGKDQVTRKILFDSMNKAYLGVNTILETCNRYYDKGGEQVTNFQDISILIAGAKTTTLGGGRYGQDATFSGTADYLDAFMAVAQHGDVSYSHSKFTIVDGKNAWNFSHNGRSLFGKFDNFSLTVRQQLNTMAVLYLRMPRWQQETYADLLSSQFQRTEQLIDDTKDYQPEPLLSVPCADVTYVKYPDLLDFDPYKKGELWQARFREPLRIFTNLRGNATFYGKKPDGRIDIQFNPNATDLKIAGLGAWGAYIDSLGFLHPGGEPRPNYDITTLETRELSLLEKVTEQVSLLIESRLPTEIAVKIHELLIRNSEVASVGSVSKFAAMLEKLLGRKPNEGDDDFVSLVKTLGMVNIEGAGIAECTSEQIQQRLEKMRNGKAELGDLDEGSILLLIMASTGSIPREFLAELLLKTYESLGTTLTLEAVSTLENLDNKRLGVLLGLQKKSHKLLDRRENLKEYLIEQGNDFDSKTDLKWKKMVGETVHSVTKMLHVNRHYDATMKSPLIAVLTAKETDQFVARCAVDGELLATLLEFVIPQNVKPYYAQTYGPEELLTWEDWYQWLGTHKESGAESHGFAQVNMANSKDNAFDILVADATAGVSFNVPPEKITFLEAANAIMTHGEATHQRSPHIWMNDRKVVGATAKMGSHLHANLALQAHQVDIAELASPDSPEILQLIVTNSTFDLERRARALDKLLIIQPHRLAMSLKVDGNRGGTVHSLVEIVELGLKTGRWGGAIHAVNILMRAQFFGNEVRGESMNYFEKIVKRISLLDEDVFQETLDSQKHLFTREDMAMIMNRREQAKEEMRLRMHESRTNHNDTTIEREIVDSEIGEITNKLRAMGSEMLINDDRDITQQESSQPTIGRQATKHYGSQIDDRATDIVQATVADSPQDDILASDMFERVSSSTSAKALEQLIVGGDGLRLEGTHLEQRLLQVQATSANVVAQLCAKKYGSSLSSDQLEIKMLEMVQKANDDLDLSARSVGLQLPIGEITRLFNSGMIDVPRLVSGD